MGWECQTTRAVFTPTHGYSSYHPPSPPVNKNPHPPKLILNPPRPGPLAPAQTDTAECRRSTPEVLAICHPPPRIKPPSARGPSEGLLSMSNTKRSARYARASSVGGIYRNESIGIAHRGGSGAPDFRDLSQRGAPARAHPASGRCAASRTARPRISYANRFSLPMTPSSQEMEPSVNSRRFQGARHLRRPFISRHPGYRDSPIS